MNPDLHAALVNGLGPNLIYSGALKDDKQFWSINRNNYGMELFCY